MPLAIRSRILNKPSRSWRRWDTTGWSFGNSTSPNADLKWLKGIMDAHHLEIVQICPYFDFTTSSETWEQSIRDAERYIEYAIQLGGPFIRTYTGNVGSADATAEQWDTCVNGLQRICEMGIPHGIVFPLETHQVIHSGPNLTDTSPTTLKLLADVGMENLTVNIQTPLLDESVFETAAQLGPPCCSCPCAQLAWKLAQSNISGYRG